MGLATSPSIEVFEVLVLFRDKENIGITSSAISTCDGLVLCCELVNTLMTLLVPGETDRLLGGEQILSIISFPFLGSTIAGALCVCEGSERGGRGDPCNVRS